MKTVFFYYHFVNTCGSNRSDYPPNKIINGRLLEEAKFLVNINKPFHDPNPVGFCLNRLENYILIDDGYKFDIDDLINDLYNYLRILSKSYYKDEIRNVILTIIYLTVFSKGDKRVHFKDKKVRNEFKKKLNELRYKNFYSFSKIDTHEFFDRLIKLIKHYTKLIKEYVERIEFHYLSYGLDNKLVKNKKDHFFDSNLHFHSSIFGKLYLIRSLKKEEIRVLIDYINIFLWLVNIIFFVRYKFEVRKGNNRIYIPKRWMNYKKNVSYFVSDNIDNPVITSSVFCPAIDDFMTYKRVNYQKGILKEVDCSIMIIGIDDKDVRKTLREKFGFKRSSTYLFDEKREKFRINKNIRRRRVDNGCQNEKKRVGCLKKRLREHVILKSPIVDKEIVERNKIMDKDYLYKILNELSDDNVKEVAKDIFNNYIDRSKSKDKIYVKHLIRKIVRKLHKKFRFNFNKLKEKLLCLKSLFFRKFIIYGLLYINSFLQYMSYLIR